MKEQMRHHGVKIHTLLRDDDTHGILIWAEEEAELKRRE